MGLAFLLGAAAGVAAMIDRGAEPDAQREPPDIHGVELVLLGVNESRRAGPRRRLTIDAVLVQTVASVSTVTSIGHPSDGLDIRVPALPVTISPARRIEPVEIRVAIDRCGEARRWIPSDDALVATWDDDLGVEHSDSVGDMSQRMEASLRRAIADVCGDRAGNEGGGGGR